MLDVLLSPYVSIFFFFSSRRRHTRYWRDWSSDVCSSDLPGTLTAEELAEWLATTDAAAVLKLGRTFGSVREAFDAAGVLDRALYVERASTDRQRTMPLADVDPATVPYFSLALLPSPLTDPTPAPAGSEDAAAHDGEVVVVGL